MNWVLSVETEWQQFHATFGADVELCSVIWSKLHLHGLLPARGKPIHLLWALMFLKLYFAESIHCEMTRGVNEKTFWKWSWKFVDAIADLEEFVVSVVRVYYCYNASPSYLSCYLYNKIKLQNCFQNANDLVVDCTDMKIFEPKPFWKGWYSHKFKCAGLHWEVASSSIRSGDICLAHFHVENIQTLKCFAWG